MSSVVERHTWASARLGHGAGSGHNERPQGGWTYSSSWWRGGRQTGQWQEAGLLHMCWVPGLWETAGLGGVDVPLILGLSLPLGLLSCSVHLVSLWGSRNTCHVLSCGTSLCPQRGSLCSDSGNECWAPYPSPLLCPQETRLRLQLSLLLRPPALAPARRTSATCSWWSWSEAPRGWGWA